MDVEGEWWDGDVQITHPGILANLRGNLRRDGDGYFIQTRVRIPVARGRRAVRRHAGASDAARRPARLAQRRHRGGRSIPATLRVGAGDVPYGAVKAGAFEARLSRAAAYQLLALAEYDERTGRGALRLGGREYALTRPD